MELYKVFYKSGSGIEGFTYIEADSEGMIKNVLHCVQGMNTELIRYEVVKQEEENE